MSILDNIYNEIVLEALLKKAVIDDHNNELVSIPSENELKSLFMFSDQYQLKMKLLFRREKQQVIKKIVFNVIRRIAILIMIVGVILFGLLLINIEVRATVRNAITEWFDKFTRYSYSENIPAEKGVIWTFEYQLKSYVEKERVDLGSFTSITYNDDENNEISFQFGIASDISFGIDNERSKYEIRNIGDMEYHIYTAISSEYPSVIIWLQDGYAMCISGFITIDELINIAQTISKK